MDRKDARYKCEEFTKSKIGHSTFVKNEMFHKAWKTNETANEVFLKLKV